MSESVKDMPSHLSIYYKLLDIDNKMEKMQSTDWLQIIHLIITIMIFTMLLP